MSSIQANPPATPVQNSQPSTASNVTPSSMLRALKIRTGRVKAKSNGSSVTDRTDGVRKLAYPTIGEDNEPSNGTTSPRLSGNSRSTSDAPVYEYALEKSVVAAGIGYFAALAQKTDPLASVGIYAITAIAIQALSKYTNKLHATKPLWAWRIQTCGHLAISSASIVSMYMFDYINARGRLLLSGVTFYLFIANMRQLSKT